LFKGWLQVPEIATRQPHHNKPFKILHDIYYCDILEIIIVNTILSAQGSGKLKCSLEMMRTADWGDNDTLYGGTDDDEQYG